MQSVIGVVKRHMLRVLLSLRVISHYLHSFQSILIPTVVATVYLALLRILF